MTADESADRLEPCCGCHGHGPVLSVNDEVRSRLEDPWRDQTYVMTSPQRILEQRRREINSRRCASPESQTQSGASAESALPSGGAAEAR